MTQKQILKKLIAHYSMVIGLCEKETDVLKINEHLFDNACQYGICHVAYVKFNEHIFYSDWVQKHLKRENLFWTYKPYLALKKSGKLKALQYRLDKMNEILNTLK